MTTCSCMGRNDSSEGTIDNAWENHDLEGIGSSAQTEELAAD